MSSPLARLAELGVRLLGEEVAPELRGACLRLAHRLHREGRAVIGLVPAGDRVGVAALALQLGDALADTSAGAVAVVDANGRWPAFPELGAGVTWLDDTLAVITPPKQTGAGAILPSLAAALAEESLSFAHLVVDLTGFDALGDHLEAAALMDVVFLVVRAGESREEELERWRRDLGRKLGGVLLVGAT